MTHHHLSFDCLDCFKRNTDHDDDRCTADTQAAHTLDVREDERQAANDCQEDGTHHCDLVKDLSNEVGCGSAGTETGNIFTGSWMFTFRG